MSEPTDRSDDVEAVIEAFADEELGELLADPEYGAEDLEADRQYLAAKREELASEFDELEDEYKDHLREGANADPPKRKVAKEKAATSKKKLRIKKKRYRQSGAKLATILVAGAVQDLRSATGDNTLGVEALRRDDSDARAARTDLADALERFDIDPSVL